MYMYVCIISQRVHIDGVGALDIETHSNSIFDRRIDWTGQNRSKMTGSRRATDLIEHYDTFFLYFPSISGAWPGL